MTTSTKRADEVLRALEPYIDCIICYASTVDEHEGNRVAKMVRDYFATPTNESPAPQAEAVEGLNRIVNDDRYSNEALGIALRHSWHQLYSLLAPAPQPPVEGLREAAPLAWNEYIREGVADEWDAETAFGTFYSVQTGTFNFMPYYDNTAIQNGGSESPEEAKAVCQADYSRRLLAALASPSLTAGASSELRRAWLDMLNAIAPAVENLAGHQGQCDLNGVMVKVSRQALDEVLNVVNDLAVSFVTAPATLTEQPSEAPPSAPDVREALYKAIYEANGCTLNDGEAVRRAIDITIAARPSIPPVADLEAIIKELQSAKDAFGEIRLDWSDPRDKCREGSAAINRAIALLHPQPAKGER